MSRKIQILVCKCGSKYAACVEPNCYTDTDWLNVLRQNVLEGGTVEMAAAESFAFEQCKCNEQPATEEPNLFSEVK